MVPSSSPVVNSPVVRRPPRHLRRLCLAGLSACFLLLLAWLCRAPLLTGLARAWIINDPPAQSDAIVVLGGGLEYRPFAAARLYKEGLAPKILIMDVALSPTDKLDLTPSQKSVTRRILEHEGVPAGAIETVGEQVSNTFQEATGVKEWARQHHPKRLLVATELFHTRRARWIFRKRLKGASIEVRFVAVSPPEYEATNWWRHEQGLIAFQNEWVKLPYYHLKY